MLVGSGETLNTKLLYRKVNKESMTNLYWISIVSQSLEGIFLEKYAAHISNTSQFLSELSSDARQKWNEIYNKDPDVSVKDFLLDYIGKPLHSLIK